MQCDSPDSTFSVHHSLFESVYLVNVLHRNFNPFNLENQISSVLLDSVQCDSVHFQPIALIFP